MIMIVEGPGKKNPRTESDSIRGCPFFILWSKGVLCPRRRNRIETFAELSLFQRSRRFRQVFWLSDHPTGRTFPTEWHGQWFSVSVLNNRCFSKHTQRRSSPITAAGPSPFQRGSLLNSKEYLNVKAYDSTKP